MKLTRPSGLLRTSLALLPLVLSPLFASCATTLEEGVEKEVKPADLEALKATGGKANGLVAWTSTREGLPHIFVMKTDGSDVRQLTRGDVTDWRPRFSPDGSQILFSRSHAAGFVRQADAAVPAAWDLYTVPTAGGEPKLAVEDAVWGSWSAADEIVFVRGSKIMRTKLGTDAPTKITDTARYGIFGGAVIQQPELSHDGHYLALTLAGGHIQAGLWSIKKKTWTQMGEGGQIAWAPDGASVYWADDEGKEGARIAREPVIAGTPADERDPDKILLVDLGGKRSRERFPRLSADGKWLVFGAAVGGLPDDVEDYELYLWEVGSSPKSATRLTFNTANDSWPDIFTGAAAPAAEEAKGDEAEKPADEETAGGSAKEATKRAARPDESEDAAEAAAPTSAPEPAAGSDEEAPAATAKLKGKKKKRHR